MNFQNNTDFENDNGQVMPEDQFGTIRFQNDVEGYGFVKNEVTGVDLFFHDIEFIKKMIDIKLLKFKNMRIKAKLK